MGPETTLSPIIRRLMIAVLALALPASAWADVKSGVAAFERGDYEKAVKEWLVAAGQGDANALFNLGQAYRLGKGVEKDLDKASDYYQRAVKAGHPAAMGNLANLYYFTVDPPRKKAAYTLWRQGARAGDARSQYMLGALTFNGEFGERDLTRGYAWTWLAARAGLQKAAESLKTMRQYVPQDARAEAERTAPALMSTEGRKYWRASQAEETDSGAPVTAESRPSADPASRPADSAAEGPVYRINLASMRRKDGAEAIWQRHVEAHGDILTGMPHRVVEVDRKGESLYRLQAGDYETAEAAQTVCRKLKDRDVGCFVVPTKE